jgi:hypothetical protein
MVVGAHAPSAARSSAGSSPPDRISMGFMRLR